LKEVEDKNATCMDASSKMDRVVLGLRSGLIVLLNIAYEDEFVVNVDEVELGVRVMFLKDFSSIPQWC